MILLDTNAVIWLLQRHRRAARLQDRARLQMSPATLLELQLLLEAGKLRLHGERTTASIATDPRCVLDEPPAGPWFEQATEVSWTRDPFDRLLVAHARVRGWKLATGDSMLLERLRPSECLAL
ncbi:MAG: PIN domain-containing protein [Vicinamibacterales bacterium]